VPLILPVRRAITAAHTHGFRAVPQFGAAYPEPSTQSAKKR
jgi:hypothetical protein